MSIADFPLELLEQVCELVLFFPPFFPRRSNILLLDKTWYRLSKPILYRWVHIQSKNQAEKFAHAVARSTGRGTIQTLVFGLKLDGLYAQLLTRNFRYSNVEIIDLSLGDEPNEKNDKRKEEDSGGPASDSGFGLQFLVAPALKHVILRTHRELKRFSVCKSILLDLTDAISSWTTMMTLDLRFRPSSLAATFASTQDPVPIAFEAIKVAVNSLASALARHPSLRAIRVYAPIVWDPFLLTVSENPNLEFILLEEGTPGGIEFRNQAPWMEMPEIWQRRHDPTPEVPATIFRRQAKQHPRLMQLILAGDQHKS